MTSNINKNNTVSIEENEVLYSVNDVCKAIHRSKQTLWRWWAKEEIFPKPILIRGRCAGWPRSVVMKWIKDNACLSA